MSKFGTGMQEFFACLSFVKTENLIVAHTVYQLTKCYKSYLPHVSGNRLVLHPILHAEMIFFNVFFGKEKAGFGIAVKEVQDSGFS